MRKIMFLAILAIVAITCVKDEDVGPELTQIDNGFADTAGYFDVDGGRLYFEMKGKRSSSAIVLLHGNFGDLRHWDNQFDALAENHLVLRFDLRGYGASDLSSCKDAYADYADQKKLMEMLNISKAHVVGLSLGACLAVDFCLMYPEMCLSLIPVGPSAFGMPTDEELYATMDTCLKMAFEGQTHEAAVYFMTCEYSKRVILSPTEKAIDIVEDNLNKRVGYGCKFYARKPANSTAYVYLADVKCPVFIVTAEADLDICKLVAEKMDDEISDSKITYVPGAGHIVNVDNPQEFNKQVLEFIETVDANSEN